MLLKSDQTHDTEPQERRQTRHQLSILHPNFLDVSRGARMHAYQRQALYSPTRTPRRVYARSRGIRGPTRLSRAAVSHHLEAVLGTRLLATAPAKSELTSLGWPPKKKALFEPRALPVRSISARRTAMSF